MTCDLDVRERRAGYSLPSGSVQLVVYKFADQGRFCCARFNCNSLLLISGETTEQTPRTYLEGTWGGQLPVELLRANSTAFMLTSTGMRRYYPS